MYNAEFLKAIINAMCKERKISVAFMLRECELNPNTIQQMTDKKGLSSFSLARIADYLNCSVDYLLGRTDCPDLLTYDKDGRPVILEAMSPPKDD